MLNHQGFAFDEDGNLIDGQHRCKAIEICGLTIPVLVTRGVQSQEFSEPTWGEEDDEDYGWGDEEFKVLEVVASKFGSHADDYHVMHSKPMRFDTNIDENIRLAFAELGDEEKELDKKIEAYRKKNRDASVEEMAKEFGVSKAKVAKRVAYLITKDRYPYRDWETDRKSTRLNSSHSAKSRMPSSA